VKWPCFYGIDFASRAELVANGLDIDGIRASIGADSLAYVSLDGLVEATTLPQERLCTACFTGTYPIEIPDPDLIGKHVLEGIERVVQATRDDQHPEGIDRLLVAGGAEDALSRP
jgi:amidophosphoribosyltransferase